MRKDILIATIVFLAASALGLFILPMSCSAVITLILLVILPFCAFIKKKELFIRTVSVVAAAGSALFLLLNATLTNQTTNKILYESDSRIMLNVNDVTYTDSYTVCEVYTETAEEDLSTGHIKAILYINGVYDVLPGQSIVATVTMSKRDNIDSSRVYDMLIEDVPICLPRRKVSCTGR